MGDPQKSDRPATRNTAAAASAAKPPERAAPNALTIASPPGSRTPPSMPSKKTLFYPEPQGRRQKARNTSEPVDPDALAKALKDFEDAGHPRERTPGTSPSRKRQRVYGDRSVTLLMALFVTIAPIARMPQAHPANMSMLPVDLSPIVRGKTSKRRIACYTRTAALQLRPSQKSALHTRSFISKRVSRTRSDPGDAEHCS